MPSGRYTAFIPEGWIDRLALRRLSKTHGFEFGRIGVLEIRDSVGGASVDWPGRPLGTCLVRKWGPAVRSER